MPDQLKLSKFSEFVAFIICAPRRSFTTGHSSLVNSDDLQKTTTSNESYFWLKFIVVLKIEQSV